MLATLALLLAGIPHRPVTAAPEPMAIEDPVVRDLVTRVNAHRKRIGCRPLIWDARIAAVAQRHSRNMARKGFFAHEDTDGRSPFDRLDRASIVFRKAGENLAFGQRDAPTVLRSWLDSRGHRANLEDCEYTRHGIGRYRDRWTHLFVRPPRRERSRSRLRVSSRLHLRPRGWRSFRGSAPSRPDQLESDRTLELLVPGA